MTIYDDTLFEELRRAIAACRRDAQEETLAAAEFRQQAREHEDSGAQARTLAVQYQQLLDHAQGVPPSAVEPDPLAERAQLVAGFREFADFLEAHPQLPVSAPESIHYFPENHPGVKDPVGEVDRVAAILGVNAGPKGSTSRHYTAERRFGPAVMYEAIVCDVNLDKSAEGDS